MRYNETLSTEEKKLYNMDMLSIIDCVNPEILQVSLRTHPIYRECTKKICAHFGNFIDSKYIQITSWNNNITLPASSSLNCHIIWKNTAIPTTSFNPYSKIGNKFAFYCIKIFKPSECPHPIQFGNNDRFTREIKFWYYSTFNVGNSQFIGSYFNG